MSAVESGPLDGLPEHPTLLRVARETTLGADLFDAARHLGHALAGFEPPTRSPLIEVLTEVARSELADLRALCHGRPLVAAEATVSLLAAIAHRWVEPDEPPRGGSGEPAGEDPPIDEPTEGEAPEPPADHPLAPLHPAAAALPNLALPPIEGDVMSSPRTAAPDISTALSWALDLPAAIGEAAAAGHAAESLAELIAEVAPGAGTGLRLGRVHRALLADLERLARLLAMWPALKRIADLLGRAEADRRRGRAPSSGRAEVTGVTWSGTLSDVLPAEWALLGDPRTEDLFYGRFAERRLLSLALRGPLERPPSTAGRRRGPIIACVDTSGSMAGQREQVAKAAVLAVARIAARSRRWVEVVAFGGPGQIITSTLGRTGSDLDDLIDFLALGFRGGTDVDAPLRHALQRMHAGPWSKADALLVTDGRLHVPPDVRARVDAARAELGCRVLGIVIDGTGRALEGLCDTLWLLDSDRLDQPGGDLVAHVTGATPP